MKNQLAEIVFATNNLHKLEEARALAAGKMKILSLSDINCHDDIPETADTLEGNALIKARWVKEKYGYDCFADDTGLMVDALDGAPGVYSARFAGPQCNANDNIALLLEKLKGVADRKARFVTVIALVKDGEEHLFTGKVEGTIATEPHGTEGFGYDPVFIAEESGLPFAEMSQQDKNAISHRGRAMRQLIDFLK
jgi:non-canonical purine NTP pyrophosphatase, rdgB/HAM1 family